MTLPDDRQPFEVGPDDAVGSWIIEARAALARQDVAGTDRAYRGAMHAAADGRLQGALGADHVSALLALAALTPALQRCTEYAGLPGVTAAGRLALGVRRAEIYSAAGAHRQAVAAAAAARAQAASLGERLRPEDDARLLRVDALATAGDGDLAAADDQLATAQAVFTQTGLAALAEAVEQDRRLVAVRQGTETAVQSVLSGQVPNTPDERLLVATALKRQLRYEAALDVLRTGRDAGETGTSLDPAWRFPLLSAEATLLILTHQPEQAEALTPELEAAATTCLDPRSARDELAVLTRQLPTAVPSGVEAALQHTRRLVAQARPEEAGHLLAGLRSRAATVRERMLWHLTAGELELALTDRHGTTQGLDQAIGHLERAVELTAGTAMADLRGFALRTLGRACYRRPGDGRASRFWAEAHRVEEAIAARQETDEVRLGMLQAAADEHDEAVRAAARDAAARGPGAVAGIVVALEAGRGNSLLAGLRPGPGTVHSPPAPGDLTGAWRWVRDLTRDIPRAQLVWLQHATPERLHHVLLGRGTACHASYPVSRPRLIREINALAACWVPEVLELSMATGEFNRALQALTERLAVTDVLRAVPGHVDRLVVVAAGELADIPFAALPLGTGGRLLDRFAVSELPSLSVRRVLRLRALRQRGDRSLLVSPPAGGLSRAAPLPGASVLAGPEATPGGLAAALGKGRVRQMRIDCHGGYDQKEHARSWLQLAPGGPPGRLHPGSLGELDLSRCGTVVLGACESGMTRRRGRDERDGFVRAALLAGAGSVLAARWPAEDGAAAAVLDRCQQYLRFLPRDAALRRAQLDVYRRTGGTGAEPVPPGQWACWTLYGDPGMQTRAGPVRQRMRARRGEADGRQR